MRRENWSEAMKADRASAPQITVGRLAAQMDKSESLVYKMLEGEHAPSVNQLVDFANLTGGHHIMRWLGRQTRHFVVPIPRMESTPEVELPSMLHEFGDMLASVNAAIADGRISHEEAARVRDEGEQLIAAVYSVILATERRATTIPMRPGTMAEAERTTG